MNHATTDELRSLRRGELPKEKVPELLRHLASCEICTAPEVAETEEHPSVEEDLFPYADGTLDPERRATVAAHLLRCALCRQDVADAREEAKQERARPRWAFIFSAAAAVVVLLMAGARYVLDGPSSPAHAPAGYGRADWNALVNDVLHGAPMPVSPLVDELRPRRDLLRGNHERSPGAAIDMQPSGVVVESQQPSLSWPAHDATSYVVRIGREGGVVIRSAPLDQPRWIPDRPLQRGVTYTWQVELRPSGKIIPLAPDVPPMFHVVDAATESELQEARRKFAADDLLLGLLSARAGLIDDARRHLRAWVSTHAGDSRAQAIAARIP